MESIKTLEKTYSSCVVELNSETQKQLGIAEGSIVISELDRLFIPLSAQDLSFKGDLRFYRPEDCFK